MGQHHKHYEVKEFVNFLSCNFKNKKLLKKTMEEAAICNIEVVFQYIGF